MYSFSDLHTAKGVLSAQHETDAQGALIVPPSFVQWAQDVTRFFDRLYSYARSLQGDWACRIKMAWNAAKNKFAESIQVAEMSKESAILFGRLLSKFDQEAGKKLFYLARLARCTNPKWQFIKADGSTRHAEGKLIKADESGVILYFDNEKQEYRKFRIERFLMPVHFIPCSDTTPQEIRVKSDSRTANLMHKYR